VAEEEQLPLPVDYQVQAVMEPLDAAVVAQEVQIQPTLLWLDQEMADQGLC
jgi:hypothetical protein